MGDTRPSYGRRISSFWLPHEARSPPATTCSSAPATESTPLLNTSSLSKEGSARTRKTATQAPASTPASARVATPPANGASSEYKNRQPSSSTTASALQGITLDGQKARLVMSASRPGIVRAATATVVPTRSTSITEATPLLSRPMLQRSPATTANVPGPQLHRTDTTPKPGRPSLLRRATDIVKSNLDLDPKNSYTYRNAPPEPSHWTDHAHRGSLLKIWDAVHAEATTSKYPKSTTAQLVSTEKQMLQEYAELGEGARPLSREWVEYVLGVCLRHPFCTAERMGRFEVLSASGGARGNWGPW